MRRLLIEWNLILLNGDEDDFFGCKVLALLFFPTDADDVAALCISKDEEEALLLELLLLAVVEEVVVEEDCCENCTMGEDELLFINDGGVVLNCNQSR